MVAPPSFISPVAGSVRASVALTWLSTLSSTALVLLAAVGMDRILAGSALGSELIAGLIGAAVLRGALAGLAMLSGARAANRLEAWLRDRFYRHVLQLGTPLRSSNRTGALVSTATEGVEKVANYHGTFLGPMIASMSSPLLVIGAIAVFIDWLSALALLVAVPLIPGMARILQKRFASVSERYRATGDRLSAQFLDALQGLPTLKMFNRGVSHGEVIAEQTESLRVSVMRLLAANQIVLLVVDALFWLGMVTLAAALAMVRLRAGAISPGEAVALVLLGVQLVEPLEKIGQFFYIGMSGRAASRNIREFLGNAPAATDGYARTGTDGAFEFSDVHFSYGDIEVLRGVSLRALPGERVGLVGISGAGKSTIVDLLQGNVTPTSGQINVGGDVSTVPQTTYLFTGTLRENLQIARPDATDEEMNQALSAANLEGFELDARIGERALTLSGGEAQRVAIARALLKNAQIVVLDEPTSNVDLESEALILEAIERLTTGRTVLIISHRLSALGQVNRTVLLEDGRTIEKVPA